LRYSYCSLPVGQEVGVTEGLELDMFLTAKLNLVSGMIIGALAVMAAKQMCRQRKTHEHSAVPDKLET
jgi:uncharacterized membrane-anchored protein YhcB (DUF1043 family)